MTKVTHARGWYSDGWTTLDCYLELNEPGAGTLNLFLPARDDAETQTKVVTICDGNKSVAVRVRRGIPTSVPITTSTNQTRPLQVYVSRPEPEARDDERLLGVVLRLSDADGNPVSWAEVSETPRNVASGDLHPDYALAANHMNAAQYLLQIDAAQAPADPVLHFLLLGHLTGATPNADHPQEKPIELFFGDETICPVPASAFIRRVKEDAARTPDPMLDVPESVVKEKSAKKSALVKKSDQAPKKIHVAENAEPAMGTHAFIEGGFCLSEDYGGGGVVFGWALHDPTAAIALVSERGPVVPIADCFRRSRDDVGAAFPSSPWAHGPSAFIGFVPDLRSGDELRVAYRSTGGEAIIARRKGFEAIKGKASDVAKQLFSILTPTDEFANRVLCADWPLLSRMMETTRKQRQLDTGRKVEIGAQVEQPMVSIIIPLYGRFDFIAAQIMEFSRDPIIRDFCEVIYVVDDPSIWAGAERLAEETCQLFAFSVSLVGDGANRGFSGANNLGASFSSGEFLLFLNSDVIPIEPGWLVPLAEAFEKNPDIGAIAPRLVYPDGGIQHAGMAFKFNPTFKIWTNVHPGRGLDPEFDEGPPQVDVPAVTGACLLTRRDHFDRVGGWDEGYLIGDFEDSDLCLALRDLGLRIVYDRTVTLVHLERQSFSGLGEPEFRQLVVLANAARHQDRWGHILRQEAHTA